jgi:two-component system NarL family response regulator
MSYRVLLVDDHTMFREALRSMLEKEPTIEIVGELGDGAQVEDNVARLNPDIVVMDISMPTVNGIEATRRLLARFPNLRVVALSAFGYKQFVTEMMDAGALAYVVKSSAGEQLMLAIQSVMKGHTYLCPETAATLVTSTRGNGSATMGASAKVRLGRREMEVLRLLAEGKSSPKIGEELHIAPSTVDVHRRNIMSKLDLHSVADLTKYAIRTGLTRL